MAPFYGHAIDMWNLIFADHWMIRESHKFVTAIGYSEKFNPQVVRLGMAWDYNWVYHISLKSRWPQFTVSQNLQRRWPEVFALATNTFGGMTNATSEFRFWG
jgi:hypothetical protein